jgi:hypothetical protein
VLVADSGGTQRDFSNDLTDWTLSTPVALQDITGIDKSAHEKLALLRDLTAQLKGTCNFAANMSHAVLSSATSSAVQRASTVYPTSNHSTPVMNFNALISSYGITRGADGALTFQSDLALSDGTVPTWA